MNATSLKTKVLRRRPDAKVEKPIDDDVSCATAPMDESWRSVTSDASRPEHLKHRTLRRSSLKGTSPSRHRRPSITFCEDVHVHPITPTTKMIKKKSELWLRTKDYERIIARAYEIVDQAGEGDSKNCTRGLENLMQDTTTRYEAWDAVLNVQNNQRKNGVDNAEEISLIYQLSCRVSSEQAKLRALQDEKDAMLYLKGTAQ
eukprot:scaffold6052_cov118-Cylindrotheca_fusiformis.AAC.16